MSDADAKVISLKLDALNEKIDKHDHALFGEDGTSGIVGLVGKISTKMSLIVWIAGAVGTVAVAKMFGA